MKICIIMIDALRQDHLGCYGYHKPTSPNIDTIANNNVIFENAFTQGNWTCPAVYSMLTGRYPSVFQIDWFDQRVNSGFTVLPDLLAASGYHTGLFSSFEVLLHRGGVSSHFYENRFIELDETTPSVFQDWIRKHDNSFLLFHIGEYVHEPYFVDRKYVAKFLESDPCSGKKSNFNTIEAMVSRDTLDHNIRNISWKINRGLIRLSKKELNYLLACYDGGINYVDQFVGEIYKILKEESEDYLFFVTADHGQGFLDHGQGIFDHKVFGHGSSLFDEIVRVPLIMDLSGKFKHRNRHVVQLMDIYPTIIELLGLQNMSKVDGVSFKPILEHPGKSNFSRFSVSEGYPYVSIRNNHYKLVSTYSKFWSFREILKRFNKHEKKSSWKRNLLCFLLRFCPDKLYNTDEDKGEKINLYWKEKEIYKLLRSRLDEVLNGMLQDSLPPDDVELDSKIKEQLARLGYL